MMAREKYQGEPGTEDMLKEFSVHVEWKLSGVMKIRATSLEAAKEAAYEIKLSRGEFVDDSFEVDLKSDETCFKRYCDPDEMPSVEAL
jgi:hypothetical protein